MNARAEAERQELARRRGLAKARRERESNRKSLVSRLMGTERQAAQLREWISAYERHARAEPNAELVRMLGWARDRLSERRRQAAIPLRDVRYLAERVRTAQVVADPVSADSFAFGSTVTFSRAEGRVQTYRIVGADDADPKAGSISYVSPIARLLLGKAIGDEVGAPGQILKVIAIV